MKRILAILCVIACLCGLCVPALAADTITVSVKAPDGWAEVYLYVWENENAYETWPGTAMTKGSDGWWTLEIPAGYTNVIANNGNEMPQTVDLKMNGTSDASITVTTDTGDVRGSLLTDKVFLTETDTGDIDVPKTTTGGRCQITTNTGDIKISIK